LYKWNCTQHLVTNHDSTWCHQMNHGWCIWSMYTCSSFDHSYHLQLSLVFTTIFTTIKYPHYLPHVLNQSIFKTMILNVEKIYAIKFQWLVMVPLGDTKIHHVTLWGILGKNSFIFQKLILAIHYEHSF